MKKVTSLFAVIAAVCIILGATSATTTVYAADKTTIASKDGLVECFIEVNEHTIDKDGCVGIIERKKECATLKTNKTYSFNFGVFHKAAIENLQLEVSGLPQIMTAGKTYTISAKVLYENDGTNYVLKTTRKIKSAKNLSLDIDQLLSEDNSSNGHHSDFTWRLNSKAKKYACKFNGLEKTKDEGNVQIGFRVTTALGK